MRYATMCHGCNIKPENGSLYWMFNSKFPANMNARGLDLVLVHEFKNQKTHLCAQIKVVQGGGHYSRMFCNTILDQ